MPKGTFRTCRVALTMSVDRGMADLALGRIEVRKGPVGSIGQRNTLIF